MTTHNIHKYYQCTEKQIHTELSPDTDGTFIYATDTQTLYISHDGGWIVATGDAMASNYTYADVDMNIITHLDASSTQSVLNSSGNPVGPGEPVHVWKDYSGRNDVYSITTTGPRLSADSLNGLSVMNFTPENFSKRDNIPDHIGECPMQSIRRSTKTLSNVTSFVVCHDPTSGPWDDIDMIPSTTSGTHNRFARPIIRTGDGFVSNFHEQSSYMVGYRRYNYQLDRYYAGVCGSLYSQSKTDFNHNNLSSEYRAGPKILWASAMYLDKNRATIYSGINGTHGLRMETYSTKPIIDQLLIGCDQHHNIGEIILCNQTMDVTDINKIGNHLSNKWSCPWDGFTEI